MAPVSGAWERRGSLAKGHLGPLSLLEALFARPGAQSRSMKDVHGGGTGCGVVGAAVTQRGQGTTGPLGQLVLPPAEFFLTFLLRLLSVSFTRQGKSRDCLGVTCRHSIMGRIFILQHPQS